MDERFGILLQNLQKELERANVRATTLSTMARIGNAKLVEKFYSESIGLKVPKPGAGDGSQSHIDILHNYIYTCCFWGSREILKRIIDLAEEFHLNIDVNAQNRTTLWTPLHAAAFQEHGPVVMLLLEAGANPHAEDSDGWTPVHYASVSEKVWPHFAVRGLQRVPLATLLAMGIISKAPDNPVRSASSARSIAMANYDSRMSSASSQSSAAAVNGDVLADDRQDTATSLYNGRRPNNNIY